MEFRILGPFEAVRDGEFVELGPAKQRELLGVLLLHANAVVSRERLVDSLWGSRAPPTAAKLVQVYVSQLRRTLQLAGGRGIVQTRPPGYAAVLEPEQLDAARFGRLLEDARRHVAAGALEAAAKDYADALALWRGAVLADLALEADARIECDRLTELRLAALSEQIDCELACGRHTRVVPELESLTAAHPLRERFWAQLMLALYRSGRQSEALGAYHEARRTLLDEVGLALSPELRRLEKAILAHDPSLELQQPRAPRHRAPTEEPTGTPAARARGRRRLLLGTLVLAVILALAIASVLFARRGGSTALSAIAPDSIGIVDPRENALVAEVPLHTKPAAIGYGAGGLWVATQDQTLVEIDPRTRRVTRTIGLGEAPIALAIGGENVWVLSGSGKTLLQFHGVTGQLIRKVFVGGRIRVGPFTGQPLPTLGLTVPDPFALAAGAGAAWIGYGGHVVSRVDAQTGAVQQIAAGSARGVAFGAGAVWSVSGSGRTVSSFGILDVAEDLWRIDPDTRAVTKMNAAPDVLDGGLGDGVAAGAGALWTINGVYRTVLKIDPGTSRVAAVTKVQRPHRPVAVTVGAGGVWIANDNATVLRIEPDTASVVRTIPLGRHARTALPVGLAAGGGLVWVAVH